MRKIIVRLFILTAIIRSSEVRMMEGVHGSGLKLCANFDIQQAGNTIDSNFQCGGNWKDIDEGIRRQLRDKQTLIDEAAEDAKETQRLKSIKNDEIGKVIRQ